jgi:hypothetical protein
MPDMLAISPCKPVKKSRADGDSCAFFFSLGLFSAFIFERLVNIITSHHKMSYLRYYDSARRWEVSHDGPHRWSKATCTNRRETVNELSGMSGSGSRHCPLIESYHISISIHGPIRIQFEKFKVPHSEVCSERDSENGNLREQCCHKLIKCNTMPKPL